MYQTIKQHPPVVEQYAAKLIKEGVVSEKEYKAVRETYDNVCKRAFEKSKDMEHTSGQWLDSHWDGRCTRVYFALTWSSVFALYLGHTLMIQVFQVSFCF